MAISKFHDKLEDGNETATENALVIFISIEEGDTYDIFEDAVNSILKHAMKVRANTLVLYPFAHLTSNLAPPHEAMRLFNQLYTFLSQEAGGLGLSVLKAPFGWYKEFTLQAYGHPLSELSRSFTQGKTRESQLLSGKNIHEIELRLENHEASRLLVSDYLNRFGFIEKGENIILKDPAKTTVGHLLSYFLELASPWTLIRDKQVVSFETGIARYVKTRLSLSGEKSLYMTDMLFAIKDKDSIPLEVREVLQTSRCVSKVGSTVVFPLATFLIEKIYNEVEGLLVGKTPVLPLSLSLVQAYVAVDRNVNEKFLEEVKSLIRKAGIKRFIIDVSEKRLGGKIREAGKLWSFFVIILGRKESETKTITLRIRPESRQITLGLDDFADFLRSYRERYSWKI